MGGLLVPMVLIFVVMYFVMIRPQSQRAKQQKKLLESLKSGDKVATASGIIGVVITVKDTTVSLRSADAKMEVTKDSITQILESANSTPKPSSRQPRNRVPHDPLAQREDHGNTPFQNPCRPS